MNAPSFVYPVVLIVTLTVSAPSAIAQRRAPGPYSCTMLASQRTQDAGCYVLATKVLKSLPPGPVFWHLYTYPTLQSAQRAAATSNGIAVMSLGKAWLFKVASRNWHADGGRRVAMIGPLPRFAARKYEARYLEGVKPPRPGQHFLTPVHRHSGVEAFYIVAGGQCIQSPKGTKVIRAGQTAFLPKGVPMQLSRIDGETERSIVLVLHDASLPWMTRAQDWQPGRGCPQYPAPSGQ